MKSKLSYPINQLRKKITESKVELYVDKNQEEAEKIVKDLEVLVKWLKKDIAVFSRLTDIQWLRENLQAGEYGK